MNILFFSRLFYPHIGGVEKHVLEVSKLLIKEGHKVTVVTEQHSRELALIENIKGIKTYRIPKLMHRKTKKFQIWKWLWVNHKLMVDADLIHCHDVFFWYFPFRFLYITKPVFTTFHGYENYPLKSKDILMHKIAEKLSRGNICVGDFIEKWYGTKANYVSYGGTNIFDIKNQKLNIKNYNSAVFIGRLDEQTGVLTYVKAIKLIRKKIPDFKFEIIGDGKLKEIIKKNFNVLGFKKNTEKYLLRYNFVFASGYLSISEALAARKLVFSVFDNPLKEDYLKMAPFSKFINISNSSSELSSKIFFYLKNIKKQEQVTENAYKWVKNHTWKEVVNVYLKLWKL